MNWNLDELVAKVMSDLRKESAVTSTEPTATAVSQALTQDFASVKRSGASVADEEEAFEVVERVLVEDSVLRLSKTTSCRKWILRPDAVVTPAAYDAFAKLGITTNTMKKRPTTSFRTDERSSLARTSFSSATRVTYSASNVAPEVNLGNASAQIKTPSTRTAQILLATCLDGSERAPRVITEYLFRNTECREERLDCMKKTTKLVADSIAESKELKAIIVTRHGAVGSVWANRLKGVRAVVAVTLDQAKRDITAADANTLILDPRDLGPYQLRQVVDFFVNRKRGD